MSRQRYTTGDFLSAARGIAAERGPAAVTVGSITERLKASTGSFYHRFISRDGLLAELWLRIEADFQQGLSAALAAGDTLRAALHTPAWARGNRDAARVLFLYDSGEFVHGELPALLRDAVAAQTERRDACLAAFAGLAFGRSGPNELRRAQFLLSEVPVAAVIQHLRRCEPPPAIVDELIAITYHAVVAAYRAGR